MSIEEKFKKVEKLYKKYDPLKNNVKFKDGYLKWKITPKVKSLNFDKIVEELKETEFEFEINKDLIKDKIEIIINIDGDVTAFTSEPGDENLKITPTIKGDHNLKDEDSGSKLSWSIQPGVSIDDPIKGLKKTKYSLRWSKNFTNKDISITFNLNGDATLFTSPPGDGNFQAGFSFNKKL